MKASIVIVGLLSVAGGFAQAAVEDDLRDGDKYFEDANWAKAAVAFDRAIAKAPSQVPAVAYGKRAAVFIIQKDYKGGLAFIEKAKARFPTAPEILEQEALILWQTDAHDQAVKVAEAVVATKPSTFTNQALIGEYYAQRDPVKTVKAYEAYLANRPPELESGDVLPRVRLGFAYLANARAVLADGDEARAQAYYQKAVDQFDLVLKKFGKKPNAAVNADNGLCAAYTGLGHFDQAVTVCERVVGDTKHVDSNSSAWFNLGTAYLARKQTKKARSAALEFTKTRKTESRGFILVGDTYFADRDYPGALDQYSRGEKLVKPNQLRDQVQLSMRLGRTYRLLPRPAGNGKNPNLDLAIEKLGTAFQANPKNWDLAADLGDSYIEAHQDVKATALTDKAIADPDFAKAPVEQRTNVLSVAGRAQYNQHKLKEARQRFEEARALRANDVKIQHGLVMVINEEAFEAKENKVSQALLDQAIQIDASSSVTITNLAILALGRNDCDAAQKYLDKLKDVRGHDSVLRLRLLARSYLCLAKPDYKKANETYAAGEKEAKKANAALALAEIYTEWAPLLFATDLNDAIDKLELALQTAQDPTVTAPAKRNLSVALYMRGWKEMREGKANDAANDFDRANRDPSQLKGTEPLAFEFSLALAQLDAGRANEALKLFRSLATKGSQGTYLKPAYAKVGPQLFAAYASYRTGNLAQRQQAATDLAKLQNDMPSGKLDELLAATWESIAYEQWRNGQVGAAQKSLQSAEKYAGNTADMKKRIAMDRIALTLDKTDLQALEGLQGTPPEALLNLGILYDQLGRPKDAYDAWTRAKARGVQHRDLQKWIDAKKRIYGY